MFKFLIIFELCLLSNFVHAGDLPNTLFKIELDKPIQEIKNSSKTNTKYLYSIEPYEKQLVSPLTELTVKSTKKSNRAQVIIGRAVLPDNICASEALRLRGKYEQLFSLQFESRERKGRTIYTIAKNKKIFVISCSINYQKKTTLSVYLANVSHSLDISNKYNNKLNPKTKNSPRKLLSAWSTDCDNMKKSRWFALESQGEKKHRFTMCGGFKCIPYPGFGENFDVYNDKRVKWLSDTTMEVSNKDKDAGWDSYIMFNRCNEY